MDFKKIKRLKLLITAVIFILFLFANIIAVRNIMRYGMEAYFYDKMLVAYHVGGYSGLKAELDTVLKQTDMPKEKALAGDFAKQLDKIKAPKDFLSKAVKDAQQKVVLLRNLRNIAFGAIILILLLRLLIK